MPIVGFLRSTTLADSTNIVAAFRQGLKEAGFVEGQNVEVEYRYADNQNDRLSALAADLIRRSVSVIVTNFEGARTVKDAKMTVPIVFAYGGDPVRDGFVASLNRPGGNMTGVVFLAAFWAARGWNCCTDWCPMRKLLPCWLARTHHQPSRSGLMSKQRRSASDYNSSFLRPTMSATSRPPSRPVPSVGWAR